MAEDPGSSFDSESSKEGTVLNRSLVQNIEETPIQTGSPQTVDSSVSERRSDLNVLVIGDMFFELIELQTKRYEVIYRKWEDVHEFESKLREIKSESDQRYSHIILHVGRKDAIHKPLEFLQNKIESLTNLAKTMSDSVAVCGPIPDPFPSSSGRALTETLRLWNKWLSDWCPLNEVGFIHYWDDFLNDLFLTNCVNAHPSESGGALISKKIDAFINSGSSLPPE